MGTVVATSDTATVHGWMASQQMHDLYDRLSNLYEIHIAIINAVNSGQEENRTPMTARSPHFECGASTSFATRPWV